MNHLLEIIEKYKPSFGNDNFSGNIYFADSNGQLQMDRAVFNKMLNSINSQYNEPVLGLNDKYLLAFKYEVFEKSESIFLEDRNYYIISILDTRGIFSLWVEETSGTEKRPDDCSFISWDEIEDIKFLDNEIFRFFIKNQTYHIDLLINRFGQLKFIETCNLMINMFNEIIENICSASRNISDDYDNMISQIQELGNKEFRHEEVDKDLICSLLEEFKIKYVDLKVNDYNSYFYYYNKILFSDNAEDAIRIFEHYNLLCDGNIDPAISYLMSLAHISVNDYLKAVNYYSYSQENFEDDDAIQESRELKNNTYTELIKGFSEVEYNQRKLVFVTNDVLHTSMDGLVVLKKNQLPEGILFPMNHPKLNEVYVCHPINKNSYLPLKEFEKELFTDRLHELMFLLGSLGAKTINIATNERNSNTEHQGNRTDVNIEAKVLAVSGSGGFSGNQQQDTSLEQELSVKFYQELNPKKAPFVPHNLDWYHSNLGWQRLAKQRLTGNLLTHTEIISSKQVDSLSTNDLKTLNAEISAFFGKIKASGNYSSESDFNSVTEKNYSLEVSVVFEDVDNLTQPNVITQDNVPVDTIQAQYDEFEQEVRFMLEDDGDIDDKEARILERVRVKLGMSVEEANEIIKKLTGFSDNEKEYLEEYEAILLDGAVTEKERRLLNRMRDLYGISEERAKEIEASYNQSVSN